MTPVAALAAIDAVTWDAALEETLSRAAARPSATTPPGFVHSVHRRAANVLLGDRLIAIVSAELDDAPWSIRLSPADWCRLSLHEGAAAVAQPHGIRIATPAGGHLIRLSGGGSWMPQAVDLAALDACDLVSAHGALSLYHVTAPQTPFGRASAGLLSAGVDELRDALGRFLRDEAPAAAITAAVGRLVGLGEGLTPSGDDVLTGVSFLAAQRGMRLNRVIPALAAGVDANVANTTLLSLATIRSALDGRARQSMHDLCLALQSRDTQAFGDAAGRVLAIGHSSGADLLSGIRLALELEAQERTTSSADKRKGIL